jgi:hypothetical protein
MRGIRYTYREKEDGPGKNRIPVVVDESWQNKLYKCNSPSSRGGPGFGKLGLCVRGGELPLTLFHPEQRGRRRKVGRVAKLTETKEKIIITPVI